MNAQTSSLPPSWQKYLGSEFEKSYMKDLSSFLRKEKSEGKVIFPKEPEIFQAFQLTPLDQVKVVILGQDPYHGEGQAHGLAFSVKPGVRIPPSLVNIFKELKAEFNCSPPKDGYLKSWAEQGVLLLNTVLTVEEGKAGSHHKRGWEEFTDHVIKVLNEEKENLVFILWGSPAQKKAAFVDEKKHCVLRSVHPSPLSAHRGFLGSKPFTQANNYLMSKGLGPINWCEF